MILPPKLLFDIEGIDSLEIDKVITECSASTFTEGNSDSLCSGVVLQEDIGYKPFLIELYVWPLEQSKSYMAHRKFGYYELVQIDDKVTLDINPDKKPWNYKSSVSIPWVGVAIYLPLKSEAISDVVRLRFEIEGLEQSHGAYKKCTQIKDKYLYIDLLH